MTDERFQLYDTEGRRKYLTAPERDSFLSASQKASREVSEALALTADRVDLTANTIIRDSPGGSPRCTFGDFGRARA